MRSAQTSSLSAMTFDTWPPPRSGSLTRLPEPSLWPDSPTRILESPLEVFDMRSLQQELLADSWTEDHFLVKVLRRYGAEQVVTKPWDGLTRNMTMKVKLGIPWEKIRLAFRGKSSEALTLEGSDLRDPGGLASIDAQHRLVVPGRDSIRVESSYNVPMLSLILHESFQISPDTGKNRNALKYMFDSFVEFTDQNLQHGIYSIPLIRRSMEMGFMSAASRFGSGLLEELRFRSL